MGGVSGGWSVWWVECLVGGVGGVFTVLATNKQDTPPTNGSG